MPIQSAELAPVNTTPLLFESESVDVEMLSDSPSQPSDVSIAAAAVALQRGSLDTDSLLLLMQTQMRDAGVERSEEGIETNRTRAEHQKAMQEIALQKAEEAGGFLGISGFLGDLLKAVVVIATTAVAAVCTGGVGAGLAVAGAVLILCAEPITDAAVAIGIVSKEDAQYFQLGVELVGAALTLGSGFAGGGAAAGSTVATVASTGSQTAQTLETVRTVAEVIEKTTTILQAINSGGAAVLANIQTQHLLDGEEAGEEVTHANELTDGQVEVIKETMAQSARSQEQLERIRKEREEAQMAALRDW